MKIQKHLQNVLHFQKTFNSTWSDTPKHLNSEQYELRRKLMLEEIQEYKDATTNVERFDAISDMLFLACGDLVSIGCHSLIEQYDINPMFDDIMGLYNEKDYISFLTNITENYNKQETLLTLVKSKVEFIELVLELAYYHKLYNHIDDGLQEVYESNMSKLTKEGEVLINGVNIHVDNKPLGKILKSDQFFEPKLQQILEKA